MAPFFLEDGEDLGSYDSKGRWQGLWQRANLRKLNKEVLALHFFRSTLG